MVVKYGNSKLNRGGFDIQQYSDKRREISEKKNVYLPKSGQKTEFSAPNQFLLEWPKLYVNVAFNNFSFNDYEGGTTGEGLFFIAEPLLTE